MAHDFLGTFNSSQFERFLAFARSQVPTLAARILHLKAEAARVGKITFTFGTDNVPTKITVTEGSYLAKLLAAYEVLGGNPYLDLRLRDRNTQAVFVVKATEGKSAQYMSSGEPLSGTALLDAPSAILMSRMKAPLAGVLHRRFGYLERKIRRALDYGDELQLEIDCLTKYQKAVTEPGSLEEMASRVQQLLVSPEYRAIYSDGGQDPLGLNVHAPFSSFDAEPSDETGAPNREAPGPQRQNSGFVPAGSKGTA